MESIDRDTEGKVEESDNMKKLRAITETLPALSGMVFDESLNSGYVFYDVGATCIGIGLLKEPRVAVQRAYLEAGSVFPRHDHKEKEVLVVYAGELEVSMNGDAPYSVGLGGCVYFDPGAVHSVRALKNSWVIAVTVPATEGYPG